ncbi:MAG: 4-alpha-glucanotransferase [Actinomycetia bacterium]|nr:4-alpha-glucanotransferase [Actinomycetes bacterium]
MYDEWGIADGYHGVDGRWRYTPVATRDALRAAIGEPVTAAPVLVVAAGSLHALPARHHLLLEGGVDAGDVDMLAPDVPLGYHQLSPLDGGPATTLIVAPDRCRDAPRGWGVAAQIYSLWRPGAWGIGDLEDVRALTTEIGERGGNSLLLSPLHAPTLTAPHDASPYYPSSRRWLNPMLIPMEGVAPIANTPGALIERGRVWPALRRALLERFRRVDAYAPWRAWADEQGTSLHSFCTWTALAERLGPRWRTWPEDFQRPGTPTLVALHATDAAFAEACDFHAWLQWLARRTLDAVTAASPVAIIADLAVGSSPDGADSWHYQDMMALDVSIGAPPDPFQPAGQEWGLPPFIPGRLRAARYRPFIDMARAALQGMSGLRIDHVMGLFRQFWIPAGAAPSEGTYVQMPAEELLAILRLEAARAGAFVIGEDLGNVEPAVRDSLRANAMLGTKVWWFDSDSRNWPASTLAMVTTHDLPTIAGVWKHTDGTPELAAKLQQAAPGASSTATAVTLHREIAASDASLCLAMIEDLAGSDQRPNYPGTTSATHHNWCHRMSATTEQMLSSEPATHIIEAIAIARGTAIH